MRRAFTLIELLVVIAIIAILAAILFPVFARARERAQMGACLSNERQIASGLMAYVSDHDDVFPRFAWNSIPAGVKNMALECPSDGYDRVIAPYVRNWDVYSCPSQRFFPDWTGAGTYGYHMVAVRPSPTSITKGRTTYGYNWTMVNLSLVMRNPPPDGRMRLGMFRNPGATIFLAENENGNHITYESRFFNGRATGVPGPEYENLTNDPDVMKAYKVPERHFGRVNFIFADGHVQSLTYAQTKTPADMWNVARR